VSNNTLTAVSQRPTAAVLSCDEQSLKEDMELDDRTPSAIPEPDENPDDPIFPAEADRTEEDDKDESPSETARI
jgi:hypothetical protein